MLETRYKSPWRKVALNNAPTVGELYAAAGGSPVTVGFALGSGALPSGCSIGGVISFCAVPWGASAVAAARITRSGGRLMAQLAKSSVGGGAVPRGARTVAATPGSGRSGSVTNPFQIASTATAPNLLIMTGTVSNRNSGVKIDGVFYGGLATTLAMNYQISVAAGAVVSWEIVGAMSRLDLRFAAGGQLSALFEWQPPTSEQRLPAETTIQVSQRNAALAIPALDVSMGLIYGNTVPWWPAGEAYAQAGIWMRRRSWSDPSRRMRFEAGPGTTAAVAVAISSIDTIHDAQGNTDFTADEFLGDDWEAYAIGEPPAVDVTDFRIDALSSRAEGFFFAVDELPVVVPPVVPPVPPVVPPDGVVVAPPASGDYVWMGRNGVGQWVLVREFACAD